MFAINWTISLLLDGIVSKCSCCRILAQYNITDKWKRDFRLSLSFLETYASVRARRPYCLATRICALSGPRRPPLTMLFFPDRRFFRSIGLRHAARRGPLTNRCRQNEPEHLIVQLPIRDRTQFVVLFLDDLLSTLRGVPLSFSILTDFRLSFWLWVRTLLWLRRVRNRFCQYILLDWFVYDHFNNCRIKFSANVIIYNVTVKHSLVAN